MVIEKFCRLPSNLSELHVSIRDLCSLRVSSFNEVEPMCLVFLPLKKKKNASCIYH